MSYNVINEWMKVKELLAADHEIPKLFYSALIKDLEPLDVIDSYILIKIEDEEQKFFLKKYLPKIEEASKKVFSKPYVIKILLEDEIESFISGLRKKNHSAIQNKEESVSFQHNLNQRYVFETFVKGSNNQLAHAASLSIANEYPHSKYNPLFIYGGAGLGKTHLMQSIAHHIVSKHKNAKVLYVTSEKFTNELINSIKDGKNEEFRNKYRRIDVLLVDDIQFISEKESTQEEFFHTFNTLYEAKKQIIISSDRPPKEIKKLEERLRSRFEWGLTVDIQPPNLETRTAILRKKAEIENLNVPNDVLHYIAQNIKSNIRELEGALTKIIAYSTLINEEITVDIAQIALKDLISPNRVTKITPEFILDVVTNHFDIKKDDIISKKRNKEIVNPRQMIMYLCKELTDLTYEEIGNKLGGRDHSTVIHGYEKIKTEIINDQEVNQHILTLTKKITGN